MCSEYASKSPCSMILLRLRLELKKLNGGTQFNHLKSPLEVHNYLTTNTRYSCSEMRHDVELDG